jgi:hypothetical protein
MQPPGLPGGDEAIIDGLDACGRSDAITSARRSSPLARYLSRKAARLLGENAALVTAQLASDTDIENLG